MCKHCLGKKYQKAPIKIGLSIAIAQAAPPRIKRMGKTKPMAMAMLMPILIGIFGNFFSKWFDPIEQTPSSLFKE